MGQKELDEFMNRSRANDQLYGRTVRTDTPNEDSVPYKDLQVVIERMSRQSHGLYCEIERLYQICHRIGYGTGENELENLNAPDGDSYLFKINGLLDLNDTLLEKLNYVVGRIDRI